MGLKFAIITIKIISKYNILIHSYIIKVLFNLFYQILLFISDSKIISLSLSSTIGVSPN
jgi:hypothetical protein